MIEFDEAIKRTLAIAKPHPRERVGLLKALGRVLREDVKAGFDIPPFDKSAMDGYAVRLSDLAGTSQESPVTLRVTGEQPAGGKNTLKVEPGCAVRIMTGAPLPAGTQAVVMQEDTKRKGDLLQVFKAVKEFENCAEAGEDVKKGNIVLRSGSLLGPAEIGMAASTGKAALYVTKRPRAAVISTGDEVHRPGKPRPNRTGIFDANGYSLTSLLTQEGCDAKFLGIARDRPGMLEAKLARAADFDMVFLSGGVSVGDFDLVRKQLIATGYKEIYWRVAMKPGKPTFLGRKGRKVVFGLPGNPVSVMVVFNVLVRPYLDALLGKNAGGPAGLKARLTGQVTLKGNRRQFLRATLTTSKDGCLEVTPYPNQKSGVLRSMVESNALLNLEGGTYELKPGAMVDVLPLEESWKKN
ncbi:MAG: molybdopterin molybdotransferase MoeA [Deltaproteobacteria bacterium]|nr:molybdopterin molybdotransferase MoeA [Deltaproteobacteria bacterium]